MKLANADKAIVEAAKLREYCLNPAHPEGRHKARVFRSALGLGQEQADWLREAILAAVAEADVASAEETPYGWRYDVDVVLAHGGKSATVRTGWLVRKTENAPRLATCFVRSPNEVA
ncbi:MAG: hypothetical protein HY850_12340 [Betaproteobacteria bacterium]|nr:hypothetical protein [Betaproteobacteria bacterium]